MFKILDCTLRDGGYYTNWDFDESLVDTYLKAMKKLPVDFVEIGYRNLKGRKTYEGKYFYSPIFLLERIKSVLQEKKVAVMFNEKEVAPQDVAGLLKSCKDVVDIVRIAVAPSRLPYAIELSKEIKNQGYESAVNLMYMSSLLSEEGKGVFDSLEVLNDNVDYFSLVDSYGGVYPDDVSRLITQCKQMLKMPIGFHGHNNIELVFANTLAAVSAGCDMVDSTVTGMGRGAGNLKTELILTHLATKFGVDVDFNILADVVTDFDELRNIHGWGTNLPYMVSGANSLPQKDVMDWISKRAYSLNSMVLGLNNQLKGQQDNIKLPVFDGAANKYDAAIIVGGGPSAVEHAEAIIKFAETQENICIIHASAKNSRAYLESPVKQYFCLVGNEGRRLERIATNLKKLKCLCILPPFPRKMGTYVPPDMIDQSYELSEITFTEHFKDSHTVLSLQTAIEMGISKIYITGYDGYAKANISSNEQGLFKENEYSFAMFKDKEQEIFTLTPSLYADLTPLSVYSLIDN